MLLTTNKVAIVDVDRQQRFTYGEFNKRVNSIANGLLALGLKKGDRVAVLFYNSPQMVETFFACAKAGLIWVALNYRYTDSEIVDTINDSGAAALVYGNDFADKIGGLKGSLDSTKYFIRESAEVLAWERRYSDFVSGYPATNPEIQIAGEDGCQLVYTGGTTGKSKGAWITHQNQAWVSMADNIAFNMSPSDIWLASAPMFHGAGMGCTTIPFMTIGCTVVVSRNGDVKNLLQIVRDEQCTTVFFVPTQAYLISQIKNFGKYFANTRLWLSASAPFPINLVDKFRSEVPHIEIRNWYGLTENLSGSVLRGEDFERLPSVGQPIPGATIKVVDEKDRELPNGEIGEVVVHSPWSISHYYNKPQETAAVLKNGWVYTGDLGKYDEDGFLYLVDRKKDMIITGGENVYAPEVENVLLRHPKVSEGVIIGVPSEKWGEMVIAVVVTKEQVDEKELIDFCREQLATYKCPKLVKFIDELPRSGFMKILKRELREKFKAAAQEFVS